MPLQFPSARHFLPCHLEHRLQFSFLGINKAPGECNQASVDVAFRLDLDIGSTRVKYYWCVCSSSFSSFSLLLSVSITLRLLFSLLFFLPFSASSSSLPPPLSFLFLPSSVTETDKLSKQNLGKIWSSTSFLAQLLCFPTEEKEKEKEKSKWQSLVVRCGVKEYVQRSCYYSFLLFMISTPLFFRSLSVNKLNK